MISLILGVACVGVLVHFITKLPMLEPFKELIVILAVIFVILVLVQFLGLDVAIPRFHR